MALKNKRVSFQRQGTYFSFKQTQRIKLNEFIKVGEIVRNTTHHSSFNSILNKITLLQVSTEKKTKTPLHSYSSTRSLLNEQICLQRVEKRVVNDGALKYWLLNPSHTPNPVKFVLSFEFWIEFENSFKETKRSSSNLQSVEEHCFA